MNHHKHCWRLGVCVCVFWHFCYSEKRILRLSLAWKAASLTAVRWEYVEQLSAIASLQQCMCAHRGGSVACIHEFLIFASGVCVCVCVCMHACMYFWISCVHACVLTVSFRLCVWVDEHKGCFNKKQWRSCGHCTAYHWHSSSYNPWSHSPLTPVISNVSVFVFFFFLTI